MPNLKVQIKGLDKVLKNIEDKSIEIQNNVKEQVAKSTVKVQYDSKKDCPVDTGRLRSSIRMIFQNNGFVGYVFSDVKYAVYVHFGTGIYASNGKGRQTPWLVVTRDKAFITRGMKPRPFMSNAWENERSKFFNNLKKIVR